MSPLSRSLRLTAEFVALCHRHVEDPGPDEKDDYFTDADYRRVTQRILDEKPRGPLWIFAYGSLIWKPEFTSDRQMKALAKGWHRAFSLEVRRYRGSPEQPGYMMCLDPGGVCEGIALSIADKTLRDDLHRLLYREIGSYEAISGMRWINLDTGGEEIRALTFYAGPDDLDYFQAGRPIAEVARALSLSCGLWGSGAEYLRNTILHLEELGIHDPYLWELQDRVAAEIESRHGGTPLVQVERT